MSTIGYQRDKAAEAAEVPRDRYGRPLVVPLEGGEAVAYTRVSTLAKALDDLNNLMAWKARKTAEGLLRRPDLITRIAGILANGDPDTDWPTKRSLNEAVEQATEAAGVSKGRTAGTGFHSLTEAIDAGREPLYVPEEAKPRLQAYREALAEFTVLDIETFIVCDELRAAGTFDRLLLNAAPVVLDGGYVLPPGVRVADLKSGKSEADYPLGTTTQIGIYANGVRYDPETQQRAPLHADLDLTTGLLIHLPPSGGCRVIGLDIEKGWRAARLAAEVHHDVRRWRAADLIRWEVGA